MENGKLSSVMPNKELDQFQDALMNAILDQFVECADIAKGPWDEKLGNPAKRSQAPYYLKEYEDNLYEEMDPSVYEAFDAGQGGEIKTKKIAALRSSSAMTFNLFGNEKARIVRGSKLPKGTYEVKFEHPLPTLPVSTHDANIDVYLLDASPHSKETVEIFCEMKMCEWLLGNATGLRETYLCEKSYEVGENQRNDKIKKGIPKAAARTFIKAFDDLLRASKNRYEKGKKAGQFRPRLRRYDAFQMLKHLLAIYTKMYNRAYAESRELNPNKAMLINCVWEMEHPEKLGSFEHEYLRRLSEEHEQYGRFAEVVKPVVALFQDLDVDFSVEYLTFSELAHMLELSADRRSYLRRYEV